MNARFAAFVAVCVVTLALAVLHLQRRVLYLPTVPGIPASVWDATPDEVGLTFRDVRLRAADGVRLQAWLLMPLAEAEAHRPAILFFQGNAGNTACRLPFLKALVQELGCPVLAPSYRGYGRSGGTPEGPGIQLDAAAALDYLRRAYPERPVVAFGRSLGGAVALHLAAARPKDVAAVVAENAFTSVGDMVGKLCPALRALFGPGRALDWLVRDKWDNAAAVRACSAAAVPVLLLASARDTVVPPSHSRMLADAAAAAAAAGGAAACRLVPLASAGHMDAYETEPEAYWRALREALDDAARPPRVDPLA